MSSRRKNLSFPRTTRSASDNSVKPKSFLRGSNSPATNGLSSSVALKDPDVCMAFGHGGKQESCGKLEWKGKRSQGKKGGTAAAAGIRGLLKWRRVLTRKRVLQRKASSWKVLQKTDARKRLSSTLTLPTKRVWKWLKAECV